MRMISGFGYRNPEGYPDPTAYSAINNVEKTPVENKTSPEDEERFRKLLNTIFTICELAGFHIEGRIAIKDCKTKVSELTNDSKYTTMPDVEKKGYQTKANVTKITKDTVTTTYVNALDITAKQVNCKSGSKEANINAGASHYKYSNEYIGEIGTNSWTGNDNRRGLVFDLDENGDYMTWAAQPKSGQSYLVKLLYERNGYTSNTVTYNADTINLGCDVDMHYYKLKNVSCEICITASKEVIHICNNPSHTANYPIISDKQVVKSSILNSCLLGCCN